MRLLAGIGCRFARVMNLRDLCADGLGRPGDAIVVGHDDSLARLFAVDPSQCVGITRCWPG